MNKIKIDESVITITAAANFDLMTTTTILPPSTHILFDSDESRELSLIKSTDRISPSTTPIALPRALITTRIAHHSPNYPPSSLLNYHQNDNGFDDDHFLAYFDHWNNLTSTTILPENTITLIATSATPTNYSITDTINSGNLYPPIPSIINTVHNNLVTTETSLFKVDFNRAFFSTITNYTPTSSLILVDETTLSSNTTTPEQIATIVLEPDLRIHYPGLAILLSMICVLVVFGNGLTMLSICKERYLRTVTNYFVASLAFADCLVGSIVMPFSIVHEVMNKWWIFGQNWCDLWHSFDVLASTASILNLCVISLDRYWAITDPITYPSRMTPRKAFIFILCVWLCSALISFPAIVWWRAVQKSIEPYRCMFTDDVGYLVFSSIISFYGPLTIMVFTYYRIYVVASEQNRFLKSGVKQIEMSCIGDNQNNNNNPQQHSVWTNNSDTNHMAKKNSEYYSGFTLRIHRGGGGGGGGGSNLRATGTTHQSLKYTTRDKTSSSNGAGGNRGDIGGDLFQSKSHLDSRLSDDLSSYGDEETTSGNVQSQRHGTMRGGNHSHSKMTTNWSVGRRLTKLAKERKAAKTLGIVMGVFILCWLPFFVTNILMGICPETCIVEPDLVFSVVTWLGWLNSAMNPIIYACWSKDFRRAFRKLLCSCFMRNSSLSYNRNRIYKAQQANNRYNYNLYYKSRIKNRQQQSQSVRQDFNETPSTTTKKTHSTSTMVNTFDPGAKDDLSSLPHPSTIARKQLQTSPAKTTNPIVHCCSDINSDICHQCSTFCSKTSPASNTSIEWKTSSLKRSIDQSEVDININNYRIGNLRSDADGRANNSNGRNNKHKLFSRNPKLKKSNSSTLLHGSAASSMLFSSASATFGTFHGNVEGLKNSCRNHHHCHRHHQQQQQRQNHRFQSPVLSLEQNLSVSLDSIGTCKRYTANLNHSTSNLSIGNMAIDQSNVNGDNNVEAFVNHQSDRGDMESRGEKDDVDYANKNV